MFGTPDRLKKVDHHAPRNQVPAGRRVWRDSTPHPVRFKAMTKAQARLLWRKAVDFDRRTKLGGGKHGGAIGHVGLRVLDALLHFLNWRTGQLDPSYAAIAARANCCVRTVGNALRRLKELGIVSWERRCRTEWQDGRALLRQDTNAYAMLPESCWADYADPPSKPQLSAPLPDSWGRPSRVPDILEAVALAPTPAEKLRIMDTAQLEPLEAALARLQRSIAKRNTLEVSTATFVSEESAEGRNEAFAERHAMPRIPV